MINDLLKDSGVEVLEPRIIKGIQLDDPTVILGNGNNYRAKDGNLNFDWKDEVVKRSVVTHKGEKKWPCPDPLPMLDAKKKKEVKEYKKDAAVDPW